MDYNGFPFFGSNSGGGVAPFPVSSNGSAVTNGNFPKYLDTTGQLVGDSGTSPNSFLSASGGSVSGDIDMKDHNIINLKNLGYNSGQGISIGDSKTTCIDTSICIGKNTQNSVANSMLIGDSSLNLISGTGSGLVDLGDTGRPFKRGRFTGSLVASGLGSETTSGNIGTNALALGNGAVNATSSSVLMGDSLVSNIRPNNDVKCDLGSSSAHFNNVYANSMVISTQVITPADGVTVTPIDTTKDTIIIDTRNWNAQVSLGTPAISKTIKLQLITQYALAANINVTGYGYINLNSSTPAMVLSYNSGTWYIINQFNSLGNFLPRNQVTKLVPVGYTTAPDMFVLAVSADGFTVLCGGTTDSSQIGNVYVFFNSGTLTSPSWAQQARLQGTGYTSGPDFVMQGWSGAISADGNTIAFGGPMDNSFIGAIWVFTRSGTTWTQQQILKPTSYVGVEPQLGISVAMSADAQFIFGGAPNDNFVSMDGQGSVFIFKKSAGTYSQVQRFLATGTSSTGLFGQTIVCTADGKTFVACSPADAGQNGSCIIATTSDFSTWTQVGSKFNAGVTGNSFFGANLALSADGSILYATSKDNNNGIGSVYVFTVTNNVPTLITNIVGSGTTDADIGSSIPCCSADGEVFNMMGVADNSAIGCAWEFVKDQKSNVYQYGSKLTCTGATSPPTAFGGASFCSAQNNILAISAGNDNNGVGALYIFN